MAGVTKDGTAYRLRFYGVNKERLTYYLGKASSSKAEEFRKHVDRMERAFKLDEEIPVATVRWLDDKCPDDLREKLAQAGFVEPLSELTLAEVADAYIEYRRHDSAANSLMNFHRTKVFLEEFLSPGKLYRSIRASDADQWREWMERETKAEEEAGERVERPRWSPAYISKRVKQAKQIGAWAQKQGISSVNPFSDLVGGSEVNRDRLYFVTHEQTVKIIEACPDAEARLIFGLARIGGLRCPGAELMELKWDDINLADGWFLVTSPKTRKQGKPFRKVPIFPELRPLFEEARELAEDGQIHVVHRHRKEGAALTSQFKKIRRRAGVEEYPKLWQNCRASRETELLDAHPIQAVCDWIGNSPDIAKQHYLMTTGKHFEQATQEPTFNSYPFSDLHANEVAGTAGGQTRQKPRRVEENPTNADKHGHKETPCFSQKYTRRDSNSAKRPMIGGPQSVIRTHFRTCMEMKREQIRGWQLPFSLLLRPQDSQELLRLAVESNQAGR